jgi:hypothetical protein
MSIVRVANDWKHAACTVISRRFKRTNYIQPAHKNMWCINHEEFVDAIPVSANL